MLIQRENGYALNGINFIFFAIPTLLLSLILYLYIFEEGMDTESWRLYTRYTARLAFFLFIINFLTSPIYDFYQNKITIFLRNNRRNTGLSFSLAHFIHLQAFILFSMNTGETLDIITIIGGGTGYILLFTMTITSNNFLVRKIGLRNWKIIHRIGTYYLAFIFAFDYTVRLFNPIMGDINYTLFSIIWLAILIRLINFTQIRTQENE